MILDEEARQSGQSAERQSLGLKLLGALYLPQVALTRGWFMGIYVDVNLWIIELTNYLCSYVFSTDQQGTYAAFNYICQTIA